MRIVILLTDEAVFHPPMFHEIIRRHGSSIVGAALFPGGKRTGLGHAVLRALSFDGVAALPRLAGHFLRHRWRCLIQSPPNFSRTADVFSFHGIPLQRFASPNDPDCLAWVRSLNVDIVFNNQPRRLRPEILAVPALACINRHTACLPAYRGVEPVVHALLNGESSIGVCIHTMTAEFDAGCVLASRTVPADRSVFRCYDRTFKLAADLFDEAVSCLQAGQLPPPIDPDRSAYYREPTAADRRRFRALGLRYL